jgi:hypothetical protein
LQPPEKKSTNQAENMKIRQVIGSPEMGYCKAGCQRLFGLCNLWTFFHMNKTRLVLFLFEPSEASSEKTTRRHDPHGLERSSWFPWFPWFANLPVVRVLDSLMGRSWDQSPKSGLECQDLALPGWPYQMENP